MELELNSIHQGDSLELMASIPSESVAVTVTSPPYNMGFTNPPEKAGHKPGRHKGGYDDFRDAVPRNEYIGYHRAMLTEIMRVLKPDGLLWYVHRRQSVSAPDGQPFLPDALLDGFPVRSEIIWDKLSPGAGFSASGRDGRAFYPTQSYETIFLIAKTFDSGMDRQEAGRGDIWRIPRQTVNGHPAPFPVELAARCILASMCQGLVFDPFMGSGSTALAATKLGRGWLGFERSPQYIKVATQRIASMPGAPLF